MKIAKAKTSLGYPNYQNLVKTDMKKTKKTTKLKRKLPKIFQAQVKTVKMNVVQLQNYQG